VKHGAQHFLWDRGKPRKTLIELTGRRTFRMQTDSGIKYASPNISPYLCCCFIEKYLYICFYICGYTFGKHQTVYNICGRNACLCAHARARTHTHTHIHISIGKCESLGWMLYGVCCSSTNRGLHVTVQFVWFSPFRSFLWLLEDAVRTSQGTLRLHKARATAYDEYGNNDPLPRDMKQTLRVKAAERWNM
jgi:hypothetical protein